MTAEELLMSEESEAFEYSNVITIDRESRAINVPLGQEMLGVEGDKSASIKHFLCPKIVGDNIDIDLSEHNLYVNYTISDEKGNQKSKDVLQAPCENIVVNGEDITFDWEISEWVTQEDGFIAFSIVAKKSVDGILQTRWYTTPAVGRVLRTIKEGANLTQKYPDVIDNLMNRVSDLERILANGGGTGGSIVVDDALSETSTNPVQNKVVAKEIRQLSEEIADLKENGTGTAVSSVEPMDDDIPKVYFTGTLPKAKEDGDVAVVIRYVSKTEDFTRHATLKVQGGTSVSYPKKNFTLKMYEDEALENKVKYAFKNWGELNKWVLKAHWIDHSHVRNVGTAKIWSKIVASRSDYNSLPEELRNSPNNGATDGFTVKVFANGIYQGLYEWIVPKDKLFGQDSDIATHSILNSEWNNQLTCAFATTEPTMKGNWSEELQDELSVDTSASFANLIRFVASATDEEFVANLGNYVDVQSVIDFDIFARVFCIVDNLCRNQIFFKYDSLWYEGAWDLDAVLGLQPLGAIKDSYDRVFQTGYCAYVDYGIINMLYQRVEECFTDRVKERYAELRADVLSASSIIEVYERLTDVIQTYDGLLEEDFASTTADGAFTGIPSTSTNNIQQLRNFVAKRLTYMDGVMEVLGEAVIYSITSNLTGCSLSNATGTAEEGASYTATVSADSGYTLGTVTVTMGGTDITSTAYSDGVITIPSVTGNVIITAIATANEATVYEYYPDAWIAQNPGSDVTGLNPANYPYVVVSESSCYALYKDNGGSYELYNETDGGGFFKRDIEVLKGQTITIEYQALSPQKSYKSDMYVYDARKISGGNYYFVPSGGFNGETQTVTFTAPESGTIVIGGFHNETTGYDTVSKKNFNGKYIKVSVA